MKYYKDIDIPLYNWELMQEGKIEYCRIDLEKGTKELDEKNALLVKDSYYEVFGVSKEYLRVLDLYKEIAEAKLDWIVESDDFILNRIKHLETELEEILGRTTDNDLDTNLISLSKWIGFAIRKKETTVREFYKMVKLYAAEMETRIKSTTNGKD